VRLLPAGATKEFVHLVGNKRFPDILIEDDFPNRIIPFPPEVKSVTLLGCLVHDAEVQQAVGLSELQKSKLLAVHKAFENDSTTVTGPATAKALYDGASNKRGQLNAVSPLLFLFGKKTVSIATEIQFRRVAGVVAIS